MRLLLGPALIAAAAVAPTHKPESLSLKSGDKVGAVAFHSRRHPDNYYLHIARIEPDGRPAGFWRVPVTAAFRLDPSSAEVQAGPLKLSALKLKPGRYAFKILNQNAHWEGCLWSGTLACEVRPATVSYIGEIDFAPVKDSLVALARAEGDTVARSIHRLSRYKEALAAPRHGSPGTADLSAVRAALPRNAAPVVAQTPAEFRFRPEACW